MMRSIKPSGFTLVELMIVVAILGLLGAVAVAAYGIYIKSSRNAEATSVLADIKLKQEAYRGTFHRYADVSTGCGNWTPRATPTQHPATDAQMAAIPAACLAAWRQIGVSFATNLYFVYDSRAGAPGDDLGDNWWNEANNTDFWYGAKAIQDLEANNRCAGFKVVSGNMSMIEIPESEDACDY